MTQHLRERKYPPREVRGAAEGVFAVGGVGGGLGGGGRAGRGYGGQ